MVRDNPLTWASRVVQRDRAFWTHAKAPRFNDFDPVGLECAFKRLGQLVLDPGALETFLACHHDSRWLGLAEPDHSTTRRSSAARSTSHAA
jgi:hypothetical protein